MNNKILKGISLIFFGILLSISGAEINSTILYSFSDFPFSLIGLIIGTFGIVMIFRKNNEEKQ